MTTIMWSGSSIRIFGSKIINLNIGKWIFQSLLHWWLPILSLFRQVLHNIQSDHQHLLSDWGLLLSWVQDDINPFSFESFYSEEEMTWCHKHNYLFYHYKFVVPQHLQPSYILYSNLCILDGFSVHITTLYLSEING